MILSRCYYKTSDHRWKTKNLGIDYFSGTGVRTRSSQEHWAIKLSDSSHTHLKWISNFFELSNKFFDNRRVRCLLYSFLMSELMVFLEWQPYHSSAETLFSPKYHTIEFSIFLLVKNKYFAYSGQFTLGSASVNIKICPLSYPLYLLCLRNGELPSFCFKDFLKVFIIL